MQIGTGLQNKLLQAMAMKLPCVTSDLTRKGIAAREKNILLVAETPAEYTNMIIKLLKDEKYADDVANRGYDYIKATFDWVKIIGDLESIFVETVKNLKVVQSIK
jgi:glycosyltransferase involved in cell wall biosynthesis